MVHRFDVPRSPVVVAALSLLLVACGDDSGGAGGSGGSSASGEGGATSSTTTGDGGSAAAAGGGSSEPTRSGGLGIMRVAYPLEGGMWVVSMNGRFNVEPDAPPSTSCIHTTVGNCAVEDCPVGESGGPGGDVGSSDFARAGAVTIEGLTFPVRVLPAENGSYTMDLGGGNPMSGDEPFAAGTPIRFVVEGDEVPAFDVEIPAPARLKVTAPPLDGDLVVARDEDLTLRWEEGPGAGGVAAYLQVRETSPTGEVVRNVTARCWGDVADGSLTMPVEVLDALPPTAGADLLVLAGEDAEVIAGDWRVFVSVFDVTVLYASVELQ